MLEDELDDGGVFDVGDDLEVAAAGVAGLDVDIEHALEAPGPGHGNTALSGVLSVSGSGVLRPQRAGVTAARCGLFGANTPW